MAAVYRGRGEPFSDEEMRIWRERDEAWARMEAEFPRVKAEHPDMWVAFCKDGFIAANDDLFALIEEYEKDGVHGRAGSHRVHARLGHPALGRGGLMVIGWFSFTGRPFVRVRVTIPRLGIRRTVEFLVDTGSDSTCVNHRDAAYLRLFPGGLAGKRDDLCDRHRRVFSVFRGRRAA